MTIALDHVQDGDWDALNRVVDTLRSLVLDPGGQSAGIRFGASSVTFTASANSASTTVTHGLGKTPVAVSLTATGSPAFGNIPLGNIISLSATTFVFNAEVKTAFTGTVGMLWIALG